MSPTRTNGMSALAPAVPNGRDALSYALIALAAVLVLGVGALVYALFRPLPSPSGADAPGVIAVPDIEDRGLARAERQRLVDALTGENHFAHGRGEWVRATQLAKSEEQTDEPKDDTPAPTPRVDPSRRVVNDLGEVLTVLEREDATGELKRAIDALDLRGLFTSTDGTPHAMIFRKHREKSGRTTPYRAGETFEFSQDRNDDSVVRVENVDMERGRVAVSREGETVWLRLRERSLAMGGSTSDVREDVFVPGESVPVVRPLTNEQIRADMRAAGMSDAQIDEYFELAAGIGEETEQKKPTGLAAGLMDAVKQIDAGNQAATAQQEGPSKESGAGEAPGGIGALLKMMSTGERPSDEMLRNLRSTKEEDEGKKEETKEDDG